MSVDTGGEISFGYYEDGNIAPGYFLNIFLSGGFTVGEYLTGSSKIYKGVSYDADGKGS